MQIYDLEEIIVIDMKDTSLNYLLIWVTGRFSLTGSATPNRVDQIKMEFFLADIYSYALQNSIQSM